MMINFVFLKIMKKSLVLSWGINLIGEPEIKDHVAYKKVFVLVDTNEEAELVKAAIENLRKWKQWYFKF